MINARSETVAEKPSFRNAFKKRRCLILADGFYEWKGEKGHKQPMFITLPHRKPFAFAGLWETWNKKPGSDSIVKSCTIITTQASESFSEIHHRMPVILNSEIYEPWLDSQNHDLDELKNILKRESITELVSYPVSKQVNSASNNNPACIEPIA
jgi:putative SOS response-associated peptidase YedK